jgi:hypothetical protein
MKSVLIMGTGGPGWNTFLAFKNVAGGVQVKSGGNDSQLEYRLL